MGNSVNKNLTGKQRKFVKAKVEGMNNMEAYADAGYSTKNRDVVKAQSSTLRNKPHIQKAIDDALELHGATPEWAVKQLMSVAKQDKEIGAKRLASKDILELHGWNKADRPTLKLEVKNAFFQGGRDRGGVIDVEATDDETDL